MAGVSLGVVFVGGSRPLRTGSSASVCGQSVSPGGVCVCVSACLSGLMSVCCVHHITHAVCVSLRSRPPGLVQRPT